MSFLAHLDELRVHLIVAASAWLGASAVCFAFSERILSFLIAPVGRLVFLRPTEPFFARVHIAMLAGVIAAFPVFLDRFYRFVSPGLEPSERRMLLWLGPPALGLFLLGTAFAWFLAVPAGLRFLLAYATPEMSAAITLEHYVSFIGTLVLAFGVLFELPLVVVAAAKLGLVSPSWLASHRRHAFLALLVAAAALTPGPDVFSQMALAIPTYLLFELAVFASRWVAPRPLPREPLTRSLRPMKADPFASR